MNNKLKIFLLIFVIMNCQFENCIKPATYGPSYGNVMYCKSHKLEECKLMSVFCKTIGCNKHKTYNYENVKGKMYCISHKLGGMVSKDNRICHHENCNLRPAYNYKGEFKPIYCFSHKMLNMISVINYKKCIYDKCEIRPTFNYEGEIIPIYCSKHKLANMTNVKSKRCEYNGCNKLPSYNYKNESCRRFCSNHRLENMVLKNYKKCEREECNVYPSFNYENETAPRFCFNHKLDGMIDVVSKRCENGHCNVRPSFNYKNEHSKRFCFKHKLDGMVSNDNIRCKANLCFGSRGNKNYNGYCTYCFQNLFPEDPLTLQIQKKSKELKVRDYLSQEFEGFIHDKPLWTENCDCTHRRRIDFRKLIGNTLLCIEVDENQHKGYNEIDEEIRYDDLYMIHGGKFIFIRFNPDKFKRNDKTCNPTMPTRLSHLKDEIERQMYRIENELNNELVEIAKLFYDS